MRIDKVENMSFLLAADIGGTNSRFALFALKDASTALPDLEPAREQWLPTTQYGTFAELACALPIS